MLVPVPQQGVSSANSNPSQLVACLLQLWEWLGSLRGYTAQANLSLSLCDLYFLLAFMLSIRGTLLDVQRHFTLYGAAATWNRSSQVQGGASTGRRVWLDRAVGFSWRQSQLAETVGLALNSKQLQ